MKSLHSWGFPSRGGIVTEQIYLCRYYSVLLMLLNVKKNIEMGRRGRGYLGWEGSAVHAGWLGKVAFEQKPKKCERAAYVYTWEWNTPGIWSHNAGACLANEMKQGRGVGRVSAQGCGGASSEKP